jgi:uncharacterized protein
MAAKVDNGAVQDGYGLYHHVIFFNEQGHWTIVQQGMNTDFKMARRYHWSSDNIHHSFLNELIPELYAIERIKMSLI